MIQGLGFRVKGFGNRALAIGYRILGLGFWFRVLVQGCGFRVCSDNTHH
jgi:hypothetical protein